MALTLEQLEGMRDAIVTAIAGGTLRVHFEGRGVTYRSVVEMQAALTTINTEIEQAGGGNTSPRQIVITPKGIRSHEEPRAGREHHHGDRAGHRDQRAVGGGWLHQRRGGLRRRLRRRRGGHGGGRLRVAQGHHRRGCPGGQAVYWDSGQAKLTKTAGTGSKPIVGVATAAAGNGVTTVNCLLMPTGQTGPA